MLRNDLIALAVLVGFFGDLGLQVMTKQWGMGGPTGWGLLPYFEQHGTYEALFVAAGMMGLFYVMYQYLFGLPYTALGLSIFGIVLDLIFRYTRLFPSLDGYYRSLNHFWSAFWAVVPMLLPYWIYLALQRM